MSAPEALHAVAALDTAIDPRSTESARFVRQAHRIVRDLLIARPRRYWTDFLSTIAIAYGAFAVYIAAPWFSILQTTAFIVCGLATYRAVVFTHELTHRRERSFSAFTFVWNLLCGVPLLMPSFLYGDHKRHHTHQAYGTWSDPEYILRSRRQRLRVAIFLLLPFIYPLFASIRFLILTPLALLSSRLNRFVWVVASSLYVMNESYRRDYDAAASAPSRWIQELACSAWAWLVTALVLAERVPASVLGQTYLVALLWIALNQVRTLVAHRYTNQPDSPVSYVDQLLDTNTFPCGKWLPELWAPVGLRYHALHHVLPMIPYHAMRDAHHRLMLRLPPDSPYHQTVRAGLWPVLTEILRRHQGAMPDSYIAVSANLTAGRQGSR